MARIGQGKFRNAVITRADHKCDVTGLTKVELLVASHILPWADCKIGNDQLDPDNGLLLTPNLDKLFDGGFISFDNDGHMLLRSRDDQEMIQSLLSHKTLHNIKLLNKPNERQCHFLKLHRKKFKFIDWDSFDLISRLGFLLNGVRPIIRIEEPSSILFNQRRVGALLNKPNRPASTTTATARCPPPSR